MIKVLISLITIFSFLCSASAETKSFTINSIEVTCERKANCDALNEALKSLKRSYIDLEHFKDLLKVYVANNGIKDFSYRIIKLDNSYHLKVNASQRLKIDFIDESSFSGEYEIELPSLLPIKEEDFFDEKNIKSTVNLIQEISRERGFPDASVKINQKVSGNVINLFPKINLGKPIFIEEVSIFSKSSYIKTLLEKRFSKYQSKVFDLQLLKQEVEQAKKILIQYGYYLADINLSYKEDSEKVVSVKVSVNQTKNYTFYFEDKLFFSVEFLKKIMSDTFTSYKRELENSGAVQVIKEKYRSYGFLDTDVTVSKRNIRDVNGEKSVLYMFKVLEGERKKITGIEFRGNSFYSNSEIEKLYYSTASSQASADYFSEVYYEQFIELLKEKYISMGFVNIYIDKPVYRFYEKDSKVLFRIKEGLRTFVHKVNISGVNQKDHKGILEIITNQQTQSFNPIAFKEDLQKISRYLQAQGYYFSRIKNLQLPGLVTYNEDNTEVLINIEIETGLKLYTGEIIIVGNSKTRKILIKREIVLGEGELVTSEKIEQSRTNLLSLGIFSSVQIKPVSSRLSQADIVVFVREKDFGTIELAPGIRSDLGLKMSAALNYNNIDGMNKRVSFRGTVNKRFELSSLDETRQDESSSLIEYDTVLNFSEDHIFHSAVDFTASVSKSRKRFYAFDADIQRISFGVSQDFTQWFNVGLRYQLESISQFDATLDSEHGHFKIGSFTPSMTFDFRNRSVNSTKGALFNFTYESAMPDYGSQDNSELTIDYYKFINRNRFYIPLWEKGVLAISTAYGIQENRVNSEGIVGKIPNIKVFRLTGADIVRGYEDGEINRLINGKDISEAEVNTRAYMINVKVEPRMFLSDSTMVGVFYDAGRVFVDEFDSTQLRSSVGISFKYLTPVGSLDFDYGIKLLREEDDSGTLDSPGRLHVSIGFF